MNSKTTKSDDLDLTETMQRFQKSFSELENDKSISEAQRTTYLEGSIGLFSWLLEMTLRKLIEDRNWYVGILVSSSVLEDMGKERLKLIFKGKIDSKKIDRFHFEKIVKFLLKSGTIDCEVYQKLMEVKKARNDLAHNPFSAMSLFAQTGVSNNKESQHARAIIEKAGFCLMALKPPMAPIPPRIEMKGTVAPSDVHTNKKRKVKEANNNA
jgi:hypothetical protein